MKILLAGLALLIGGGQEETGVSLLVERLADERIDVRSEAEAKLIALGSSVIGDLEREAVDADEEVRARIEQVILLIRRVEREKLFDPGPSLITLPQKETGIRDLLPRIAKQVRSETVLRYEGTSPHPVSAGYEGLPLLETIYRICQKDGGLNPHIKVSASRMEILIREEKYVPFPTIFHGSFLVQIQGVETTQRVDFGRGPAESGELSIVSFWEPDTIPLSVRFHLSTLMDEKGASLMNLVKTTRMVPTKRESSISHRIQFTTLPPEDVKLFSRVEGELEVVFPRDTDLVQFKARDLQKGLKASAATFGVELLSVERNLGELLLSVKISRQLRREMPKMVLLLEAGGRIQGRMTASRTTFSQGSQWVSYDVSFDLEDGQKPESLEMSTFKGRQEKSIPVRFQNVRFRP